MKFFCPVCRQPLLPENINVQTNLALCKACGNVAQLSQLADAGFNAAVVSQPPPGTWYQETMAGHVLGATTRSPIAFFLVPFMLVWSGFSLGGIYGTQILKGQFNPLMSLFGLPFLGGTVLFGSIALMAVCGHVEVFVNGAEGSVFVGVGPVGWRRKFNLDEVDAIEDSTTAVRYPGGQGSSIALRGKSILRFGTNLTEPRRYFLLNVLRQLKTRRGQK